MKEDKKRNFSIVDDSRNPWLTILILAWPIFLEQVLTSLVQAVDTAMVGSLGAIATTSVSISQSPNMLVNGVIMALGVGFTSMIARSVGANDMERARGLVRQAILTIFALGIPATILMFSLARYIPIWMGGAPEILDTAQTYNQIFSISMMFRCMTMVLTSIYRGYGDSKTPMKVNISINVLNVIGNFLMIFPTRELTVFGVTFTMFGFGWGVAGAAAATSLSAILGSTVLLSRCFTVKTAMRISLKDSCKTGYPSNDPALLHEFRFHHRNQHHRFSGYCCCSFSEPCWYRRIPELHAWLRIRYCSYHPVRSVFGRTA